MPRVSTNEQFSTSPRHIRGSRVRLLTLRQHSDDHPMAMFFIIVATAFAVAALLSPSRAAIASLGSGDVQSVTSGKSSRLVASETDIACRGQAWGAESAVCLAVIARESGRGEAAKIRLIAAAKPDSTSPNVFQ